MPKEKIIPPYQEENITVFPDYTEDESNYRNFIITRLEKAKENRDGEHIEFDDMDYLTHYETNAKAGNSYIRPKKNPQDTRVVTGTTLEKENTVLSSLLNYNFDSDIIAYDNTDLPLASLGSHMNDLVNKSREIEDYDSLRPLIYKEGLDQGTAFVEEVNIEEWRVKKDMPDFDFSEGIKMKGIKWNEALEKVYDGCKVNLLSGTKVFLGNVKEFFIENQPYIGIADTISYAEAKSIYGRWERFKYVPRKVRKESIIDDEGTDYRDWSLLETTTDMVEVIKYYDKISNEIMIILNGVMMLPVGFPLTAISPSGEYPIAKLDIEPISKFFAYSKSFPAKTKVDQELLDDTIRTLVLRMRQLLQPPMANNTNRTLTDKIFYPGKITPNIPADRLIKILGENNQIGQAEFQVFSLLRQIVDQKTANPVISGEQMSGRRTAKEILTMKQQAMQKLGYVIFGIINFERRLAWLRLHNILANWTKPVDQRMDEITGELKNVYQSFSVETSDQYGKLQKAIEFNPEKTATVDQAQIDAEADILSTPEREVQKVYMNPELLRNVKLKWFITVTPTQKDSTELERAMFEETVMKAKQMFGPMSTNDEYVKQRIAVLAGEDPEKFWSKQQPMMPGQVMPGMPGQPGATGQTQSGGSMGAQLAPEKMAKPSLNTLAGAQT